MQEDLDSMEQELEMWRRENSRHADALRREERCVPSLPHLHSHHHHHHPPPPPPRITEDELTPLRAQLAELNSKIKEQVGVLATWPSKGVLAKDQDVTVLLVT